MSELQSQAPRIDRLEITGQPSEGQSLRKHWSSDWGNLILAGVAAYAVVYSLWVFAEWGSERTYTLVVELGFIPVMLIGVLFALRVSRVLTLDHQARRAWLLMAAAFILWMIGDTIWGYYEITLGDAPFPSMADYAYLGMYAALILSILAFPASRFSQSERVKFWLDSGIILIGLTLLVGHFIIGPGLLQYAETPRDAALLLAYPFGDILVLIVLFSILVRRPRAGSVGVLSLLVAGLLLMAITDLWWTFLAARDQYVSGGITYVLWFLGQSLMVAAPQRHYDILNRELTTTSLGERSEQLRTLLPYGAAVVALSVVLVAGVPELINRFGVVVILMTALLGLFLTRQVLTLRENANLQVRRVIRQNEERFQALVEHSTDMITVLDRELTCRFQSPSASTSTGYEPDEFLGRSFTNWVHPDDQGRAQEVFNRVLEGHSKAEKIEWRLLDRDGDPVYLETIISSELDRPSVRGLVLNSRDISERKVLEAELTYQAYHDSLTELPNRALFINSLMGSMKEVESGKGVALLFLDIDHFKLINDTLGHDTGDIVLQQVSQRLRKSIRPSDSIGRIGGDEFTILLRDLRNSQEAMDIVNRLLQHLAEPMAIAGHQRQLSASIGVAYTDSPASDAAELLRCADSAMYAAKRAGRGRAELFEPGMDEQLAESPRDRSLPGHFLN